MPEIIEDNEALFEEEDGEENAPEAGLARTLSNAFNYYFSLPRGDGEFFAVANHFPRLTSDDESNDERIHIESYRITLSNVSELSLKLTAPTTSDSILTQYNAILGLPE